MKGFTICTLVLLLGVTSFAEAKDCPSGLIPCYNAPGNDNVCCPGSCGPSTNGGRTATCANGDTAATQFPQPDGVEPTLAVYVQFDDQNPLENCAGQGGGEGTKTGDKCMYRPHLYSQATDEIIGYATFLVTYVVAYDNVPNVEEFVQFTFYFTPPGQGDNAANNIVSDDNMITMQVRFKSTGRATRSAVTGGTGTYLGANGYAIAQPAPKPAEHIDRFLHCIYLCESSCNLRKLTPV
ncbi:hypothetical protein KFL_004480020 [Klebsormidium nitens]|uniref:Dirigent protein n=1 Tax=Klebsormidium nitens TaxID=105231 RepID=A0A1Y1ICF3_KLENI|nr:hypothetical protein KFL_004480020 [Klebsormidium nitens]|eukprot:GAQ88645.1 hypothetical protein KFL_004480020 [Klebsormidium nitens]